MDNSVFFKHYELVSDGYLKGMSCVDDDHGYLHPFADTADGHVYFECLFCDYKITPGVLTCDKMRDELKAFANRTWNELATE